MHKTPFPFYLWVLISIKSLGLTTVEERRNDNVTINDFFITPKEVLFKLKRKEISCMLPSPKPVLIG